MFTKSLILVLLGSTLILANPLAGEPESATEASKTGDKFWGFLNDVKDKVSDAWNSIVDSVKSTVESLRVQFHKGKELAKDVYEKLVKKGEEIAKKGAEAVKAQKEKWDKVVEDYKSKAKETGEKLTEKVKELREKGKAAIDKEMKAAKEALEHWKKETEEELKKNNEEKH